MNQYKRGAVIKFKFKLWLNNNIGEHLYRPGYFPEGTIALIMCVSALRMKQGVEIIFFIDGKLYSETFSSTGLINCLILL